MNFFEEVCKDSCFPTTSTSYHYSSSLEDIFACVYIHVHVYRSHGVFHLPGVKKIAPRPMANALVLKWKAHAETGILYFLEKMLWLLFISLLPQCSFYISEWCLFKGDI